MCHTSMINKYLVLYNFDVKKISLTADRKTPYKVFLQIDQEPVQIWIY